jgi:hypothetical protein
MTNQVETLTALRFERETCSRCGGSGRHSFCEMYRDTCFKCAGSGQMLTKRGATARRWMNEQNLIPARDVTVGMRVKAFGMIITVRSIETGVDRGSSLRDGVMVKSPDGLEIRGKSHGIVCDIDTKFQLIRGREDQIELLTRAIAYQNSLTKAGKPRASQKEVA